MLSFMRLIQNENMKIYRRIGTWVMIGLLLLATSLMAMSVKMFEEEETGDWKKNLAQENKRYEKEMAQEDGPKFYRDMIKKDHAINQYRLEHDIPPEGRNTTWGFVHGATDLTSLITLFTVIVGAISVAGEFSWGTIKLLLIRSASRSKILWAKYLATFQFALTMLVILLLFSMLMGVIFFGIDGLSNPYLAYADGKVVEKNMFLHTLSLFGLASVNLLMMVTFAFMISAVFRSSSLAIGLATFLMFAGVQAVAILAALEQGWVKYILFANTNLTPYFDGTPLVEGMTLSFSITVLAIYFVLFNVVSWVIFNKRDVAI